MQRVQLEFPAVDLVPRHALTARIGDMNHACHLDRDALNMQLQGSRIRAKRQEVD